MANEFYTIPCNVILLRGSPCDCFVELRFTPVIVSLLYCHFCLKLTSSQFQYILGIDAVSDGRYQFLSLHLTFVS